MTNAYQDFLARKRVVDPMTGLSHPSTTPDCFKPHQSDITMWALRRGRAAVFAGTGLGKTLIELEWSRQVAMFLARTMAGRSMHGDRPAIQPRPFDGFYAVDKIGAERLVDAKLAANVAAIAAKIGAGQ